MKLKRSGNKLNFEDNQEEDRRANLIVNMFSENEFINVEEYIMGPSEDVYKCTIHNYEFQFVYDLDYGCWFQSNDLKALDLLIELFNLASE